MRYPGIEFLVVGAGLSGMTAARRLVDHGRKVLIVERRDYVGGLCSAYVDQETGIEVHRHGTHVLHSSNTKAIDFLSRFFSLNHYRHRVFAYHDGKTFPLPVNLATINQFYGMDLDPKRAKNLLRIFSSHSNRERSQHSSIPLPDNFEDVMVSRMGRALYEAFIEGYTKKHWGTDPKRLPASLGERVPVRTNYNGDYFTDPWQGLPIGGYNRLFSQLVRGIPLELGVDYQRATGLYPPDVKTVYTGSLDTYFNYCYGLLPWRGIEVVPEVHQVGDYQGTAVINFPDPGVPQTRTHEFKHLHPEAKVSHRKTIVAPEFASPQGETSYPMEEEGDLAKRYRLASEMEPNVFFLGRMATYRYLNMDQAVTRAIDLADALCKTT